MNSIYFEIESEPKGQARGRFVSVNGKHWVYSPKNDFKKDVTRYFIENIHKINSNGLKMPYNGGIGVKIVYYMKRPKSMRKIEFWHIKRPDLDNIEKAFLDGINDSKSIWVDDSQVCWVVKKKIYSQDGFIGVKGKIYFIGNKDGQRKSLGKENGQDSE